MKIRLSLSFEVTRASEPERQEPIFEHRDNSALVENNGPQKIGFGIDHGAPPPEPEDQR